VPSSSQVQELICGTIFSVVNVLVSILPQIDLDYAMDVA
jgi:hypothetical protein